ncbi:2-keto-4-pentenoate hydratase [Salinactinospora qingdaonensis]|uniref:Fumarylacetoacetate hydrolase family protein n=1 Tax=Salinactinospora qingdaonensis TaxID=702744 RepID=A0ABP7FEF2_9ACTN
MEDAVLHTAAEELAAAYTSGVPVEPLSERLPELTLHDAYRVQVLQVQRWRGAGARVKGHKVGLTSAAMRAQLGVDQPDYGHLLDAMFHLEHLPIATGAFLQPRVEPEIAFVLKRPLAGPGITAAEAAAAVDFVLPALEIIDSRVRDWRISLIDTVADNASCGGVVLGSRPVPLSAVDLRRIAATLRRNGADVGAGVGGAVLGTPLNALVWLANTLGELGVTLEEGHVVLPGSVTAAVAVAPGDRVSADFDDVGDVTAVFAHAEGETV